MPERIDTKAVLERKAPFRERAKGGPWGPWKQHFREAYDALAQEIADREALEHCEAQQRRWAEEDRDVWHELAVLVSRIEALEKENRALRANASKSVLRRLEDQGALAAEKPPACDCVPGHLCELHAGEVPY